MKIWFQNRRAKEKRLKEAEFEKIRMANARGSLSAAINFGGQFAVNGFLDVDSFAAAAMSIAASRGSSPTMGDNENHDELDMDGDEDGGCSENEEEEEENEQQIEVSE